MLFGVFLVLCSTYGIYYGIRTRRPAILIFSALGLLGTIWHGLISTRIHTREY